MNLRVEVGVRGPGWEVTRNLYGWVSSRCILWSGDSLDEDLGRESTWVPEMGKGTKDKGALFARRDYKATVLSRGAGKREVGKRDLFVVVWLVLFTLTRISRIP